MAQPFISCVALDMLRNFGGYYVTYMVYYRNLSKENTWGAWVAESVQHPTLAQVMILGFQDPAPRQAPRGICLPLPHSYCPSVSQINKTFKNNK